MSSEQTWSTKEGCSSQQKIKNNQSREMQRWTRRCQEWDLSVWLQDKEWCSHLVIGDEMKQVVLQRSAVTATLHRGLGAGALPPRGELRAVSPARHPLSRP